MLLQPPKRTELLARELKEAELDVILSPEAIEQELKRMKELGVLPSLMGKRSQASIETSKVIAELAAGILWQEFKQEELTNRKLQDSAKKEGWVEELLEDLITYELSPANSNEEADIILTELDAELALKEKSGYGPDARNYVKKLRDELKIVKGKLG